MSYDRFGRTPEMARMQRAYERMSIILLFVALIAIVGGAALAVKLLGA